MKDPIGKIISSIYRHQHIFVSRALISGKCRIGPGQIYVFLVVGVHEGLYQKDIVKALTLEKATVAKAVKKLREDGYVRTEEDPDDKRYTKVFLNSEGRRVFPSVIEFFKEVDRILLQGFSKKEIDTVFALNDRMNQNLIMELSNRKAETMEEKEKKRLILAHLIFLTTFSALATDMYLPALPTMADNLRAPVAVVNLTLALFFVFFGASMIIWGTLSDKYGRRPMLLVGTAIYVLAGLLCAFAGDVYQSGYCVQLSGPKSGRSAPRIEVGVI